jgi:hypothetical protein
MFEISLPEVFEIFLKNVVEISLKNVVEISLKNVVEISLKNVVEILPEMFEIAQPDAVDLLPRNPTGVSGWQGEVRTHVLIRIQRRSGVAAIVPDGSS